MKQQVVDGLIIKHCHDPGLDIHNEWADYSITRTLKINPRQNYS